MSRENEEIAEMDTENGTSDGTEEAENQAELSLGEATGPVGSFPDGDSEEESGEGAESEETTDADEGAEDDSGWEPVATKRERFKPRKRKLNLTEKNDRQAEALEAYAKAEQMEREEDSIKAREQERRKSAREAIETQRELATKLRQESQEGWEEVQVLVIEQRHPIAGEKRLVFADTGKEVPNSRETLKGKEAAQAKQPALSNRETGVTVDTDPRPLPVGPLGDLLREVKRRLTELDPEARKGMEKEHKQEIIKACARFYELCEATVSIEKPPTRANAMGQAFTWLGELEGKLEQAVDAAAKLATPAQTDTAKAAAEGIEALTGTEDLTGFAIAAHASAVLAHAKERGINLPKVPASEGNRPIHNWAHLAKALFASVEKPDSKASDDALDLLDHAMNVPEEELRAAAAIVARELHALGIPLTPCPIGDVPATIAWSQQAGRAIDEAAKAAAE